MDQAGVCERHFRINAFPVKPGEQCRRGSAVKALVVMKNSKFQGFPFNRWNQSTIMRAKTLLRLRGSIFARAILAGSINLECMTSCLVMMFVANLSFQPVDFRGEKLDRTAAGHAYHMVMAPPVVLMLIAGDPIMKSDFTGQPAFRQEFKSTVYRSKTNPHIAFFHQAVEFVG